MRRLLRRAFNGAAAALFAATCVLWARSYWWSDLVGLNSSPLGAGAGAGVPSGIVAPGPPTGTFVGLGSCGGSLYVVRFLVSDARTPRTGWSRARVESIDDTVYSLAPFRFAGFSFDWSGPDSTVAFAGVPHGLLLVACAFPVARALAATAGRLRARRRRRRGRCPACGYDLRATPGRCPECGAAPGEGGRAASGGRFAAG